MGKENESAAEIMNIRTGCSKYYRGKYCLFRSTVTAQNVSYYI